MWKLPDTAAVTKSGKLYTWGGGMYVVSIQHHSESQWFLNFNVDKLRDRMQMWRVEIDTPVPVLVDKRRSIPRQINVCVVLDTR